MNSKPTHSPRSGCTPLFPATPPLFPAPPKRSDGGAQLRDLQVVLGHRNIETTARYVRPNPERVPSPLESLKIA